MTLRCINREEIVKILTQDSFYRKNQKWPLLISNDFNNDINHDDIYIKNMFNLYKDDKWEPFMGFNFENFSERIDNRYKFVNEILNKFRGHIVACGGSIINTLINRFISPSYLEKKQKHSDLDLFFYDLNIEQANKMRMDIIHEIIKLWKSKYNNDVFKIIIKRNEFVTSVYVFNESKILLVEYQLIHRIYPNISSIIGGFDIGACMLAYDGNEIYATPLGSWSIKNKSIIVDTKRRSTSYEHRLVKYFDRGFRIIFPGLNEEEIIFKRVIGSASETEEIFKSKILDLIQKNGYKTNNISNIMKECMKIQNISDVNIPEQNIIIINKDDTAYLSTSKYDNKSLSQKSLNKISDYHNDNGMYFDNHISANITKLRLGNFKAVSSLIIIKDITVFNDDNDDNDDNDIYNILIDDVNNPNLQFNKKSIKKYKLMVEDFKKDFEKFINNYDFNRIFNKSMKLFGNYTNEIVKLKDFNKCNYYRNEMINIMIENNKICKENLIGIKWITKNPGRQWTSSINPIIADPRLWYGDNYVPIVTGIPVEIESCLRLMKLSESYWKDLPDDLFDLILYYINKNYADEAWEFIL